MLPARCIHSRAPSAPSWPRAAAMRKTVLPLASQQASTQYVVLGAGLDTFAYRNPFPQLRVFEVDFPATQDWKRALLAAAAIAAPANLTFVPLDFEHMTLAAGLAGAGFDIEQARVLRLARRGALPHAASLPRHA